MSNRGPSRNQPGLNTGESNHTVVSKNDAYQLMKQMITAESKRSPRMAEQKVNDYGAQRNSYENPYAQQRKSPQKEDAKLKIIKALVDEEMRNPVVSRQGRVGQTGISTLLD
jgi:hypothetical protein